MSGTDHESTDFVAKQWSKFQSVKYNRIDQITKEALERFKTEHYLQRIERLERIVLRLMEISEIDSKILDELIVGPKQEGKRMTGS